MCCVHKCVCVYVQMHTGQRGCQISWSWVVDCKLPDGQGGQFLIASIKLNNKHIVQLPLE